MSITPEFVMWAVPIAAAIIIWLVRLEQSSKRNGERLDEFVKQYRIDQGRLERDMDLMGRMERLQRAVDSQKVVSLQGGQGG